MYYPVYTRNYAAVFAEVVSSKLHAAEKFKHGTDRPEQSENLYQLLTS